MSRMLFVIVLLCFVPYSESDDMNRFCTKTPYIFQNYAAQTYPNFELKKAWGILRHGTRLPSKKVISKYTGLVDVRDEMLENSTALSERQRAAFARWNPMDIKVEHQKFLTKEGEQEHFTLGSRFRERFPDLFDETSTFTFKHTPTQRTEQSAAKFIEGLLPESQGQFTSTAVAPDDSVLRPYKGCELWRKSVKKNKSVTLKEKAAFQASSHATNLVNDFKNLTKVEHFTIEDLEVLFTICGFETCWQYQPFDGRSVWCSLFQNEEQLRVVEYLRDLEYYWMDGYGFEITRKVACKTVSDIFRHLR